MKKCFFLIILSFISFISAQEKISYNGSGNYTLKERTDLRRYDNGKYIGLVSREVTSFITPVSFENGYQYEGSFFLQQDIMRNSNEVGFGIRDSISSSFRINSEGKFTMLEDNGYPSFRSFPTFTDKSVKPGDKWTGKAERAVDPLNKGIVTKIPVYAEYTYLKDDYFHNEPVYLLSAQWATRYGMGSGTSYIDWSGDKELEKANGSHKATIIVSRISGNALVVRDNVDETFWYSDGKEIQFKGTISLFTEYPPSVDRDIYLPSLQRLCELSDEQSEELKLQTNAVSENTLKYSEKLSDFIENNRIEAANNIKIAVDSTPSGIRLSIQNIQFKANSSELLTGEGSRLDQIAEVLNTVPDAQLLVEGHTADTGNKIGEQQLSIDRAKSIANELSKRGVSPNRFICKGSGSTKPIADNNTPQGKALNRRVEITILD